MPPAIPSLRTRRWPWALFILLFIGFALSTHIDATLTSSGSSVAIRDATLVAGSRALVRGAPPAPPLAFTWHAAATIDPAWRPVHKAIAPWPGPSPYHSWVFPLWPLPVAALGYALYATAFARGRRSTALGRCRSCDYDLAGLPATNTITRCPECGELLAASPSPTTTSTPPLLRARFFLRPRNAAILFVFILAAFICSTRLCIGVAIPIRSTSLNICVQSAALRLCHQSPSQPPFFWTYWSPPIINTAWCPSLYTDNPPPQSGITVPLWPLPIAALCFFLFALGRHRGRRLHLQARSSR